MINLFRRIFNNGKYGNNQNGGVIYYDADILDNPNGIKHHAESCICSLKDGVIRDFESRRLAAEELEVKHKTLSDEKNRISAHAISDKEYASMKKKRNNSNFILLLGFLAEFILAYVAAELIIHEDGAIGIVKRGAFAFTFIALPVTAIMYSVYYWLKKQGQSVSSAETEKTYTRLKSILWITSAIMTVSCLVSISTMRAIDMTTPENDSYQMLQDNFGSSDDIASAEQEVSSESTDQTSENVLRLVTILTLAIGTLSLSFALGLLYAENYQIHDKIVLKDRLTQLQKTIDKLDMERPKYYKNEYISAYKSLLNHTWLVLDRIKLLKETYDLEHHANDQENLDDHFALSYFTYKEEAERRINLEELMPASFREKFLPEQEPANVLEEVKVNGHHVLETNSQISLN